MHHFFSALIRNTSKFLLPREKEGGNNIVAGSRARATGSFLRREKGTKARGLCMSI